MRTVAAFDFDHTLSSRDNVVPFVRLVAGTATTARALAAAAPLLVVARRHPARRDDAKARLLRDTLRGRHVDDVRALADRFARRVVERHLNRAVVERLEAHRAAGHDLVIVSASLTLFLEPVAGLIGIPTVLATDLEVGPDGRLTGEIAGANVRGPEKARRLDAWLGPAPVVLYAYGDSHGDAEMLARADHPVRVARRGRVPDHAPPVIGATARRNRDRDPRAPR